MINDSLLESLVGWRTVIFCQLRSAKGPHDGNFCININWNVVVPLAYGRFPVRNNARIWRCDCSGSESNSNTTRYVFLWQLHRGRRRGIRNAQLALIFPLGFRFFLTDQMIHVISNIRWDITSRFNPRLHIPMDVEQWVYTKHIWFDCISAPNQISQSRVPSYRSYLRLPLLSPRETGRLRCQTRIPSRGAALYASWISYLSNVAYDLYAAEAPTQGEDFQQIADDYQSLIMPGLTHWQHPSFFAYFPTAGTFEGLLAGLYASSVSNPGFSVSLHEFLYHTQFNNSGIVGM